MFRLTIFALIALSLAGCRTSVQESFEGDLSTNLDIMQTQIIGLRVGMSPRLVKHSLHDRNLVAGSFSGVTLDDVISKYDRGDLKDEQVLLETGQKTVSFLDDENVALKFCGGQLYYIRYDHFIFKSELKRYISRDKKRFHYATSHVYSHLF